ncbi:hypothetical protein AGMMS50249_0500 [candidate division SR1 bacterium]|nr:hypothetical protein AGMMS50249_0500 [candidate division SR1 bacterium]
MANNTTKSRKKRQKNLIVSIGGILILAFFVFVVYKIVAKPQICCGNSCFKIEIAKSQEERERGLMFRESLAPNEGMLFVFEKLDFYSFWMKNTLIPLEMIWLDKNYKIVDVQQAEPCPKDAISCPAYFPADKAQFVLEINQDTGVENSLRIGENCLMK